VTKIDAVAAAARTVRRVRAEALQNLKGGLLALNLESAAKMEQGNPVTASRVPKNYLDELACGIRCQVDKMSRCPIASRGKLDFAGSRWSSR
jgi:hypothetical protein